MVPRTSCPVREDNFTKCCNYKWIEALATGCMAFGEVARSEGQVREVALRVGSTAMIGCGTTGGEKLRAQRPVKVVAPS